MPKKNTLIYIDDTLVSLAKRMKINISETTETALREKMLPYMSMSEKMIVDVEGYIKEMIAIKEAFILPVHLKKVGFENIGPINYLDLDFTIDLEHSGLNVIRGPNGSGKTTILRAIAMFFGLYFSERGSMLQMNKKEGTLQIQIDGRDILIIFDKGHPNGPQYNGMCLLLDDPIARIPLDKVDVFMKKLREYWPSQIIMTTGREDFNYPGIKIFNLDGQPPLKQRSSKH